MHRPCSLSLLLITLVMPTLGQAQAPRPEVLRLVPEDAGLFLVVNQLRSQHAEMLKTSWWAKLQKSPFGELVRTAPELRKLQAFETELQKLTQLSWEQMRDDLLGDVVLFAYRPAPSQAPERERGLILIDTRDGKKLARFLDTIHQLQLKNKELQQLEARTYKGVAYHRRQEAATENFYLVQDNLFLFASHEDYLQQAIDRRQAQAKLQPIAQRLAALDWQKPLVTLWVNPRAYDAELRDKLQQVQGPELHTVKLLAQYWHAIDSIAASLTVQPDPELQLSIKARLAELPATARPLFDDKASSNELWQRLPRQTIVTLMGRLNAKAAWQMVEDFVPPESRAAMHRQVGGVLSIVLGGLDFFEDVVPNLGPEWGVCVLPGEKKQAAPHALLALRVQPGTREPPVDQALLKSLNFFVTLIALDQNRKNKPMRVGTVKQGTTEVRYIMHQDAFPAGWQPAYALKDGYLVVASSPGVIEQFAPAQQIAGSAQPFFRLSLRQLATHLQESRAALEELLVEKQNAQPATARQTVDFLLTTLSLFESVEIGQRTVQGQLTFSLRLHSAASK